MPPSTHRHVPTYPYSTLSQSIFSSCILHFAICINIVNMVLIFTFFYSELTPAIIPVAHFLCPTLECLEASRARIEALMDLINHFFNLPLNSPLISNAADDSAPPSVRLLVQDKTHRTSRQHQHWFLAPSTRLSYCLQWTSSSFPLSASSRTLISTSIHLPYLPASFQRGRILSVSITAS